MTPHLTAASLNTDSNSIHLLRRAFQTTGYLFDTASVLVVAGTLSRGVAYRSVFTMLQRARLRSMISLGLILMVIALARAGGFFHAGLLVCCAYLPLPYQLLKGISE